MQPAFFLSAVLAFTSLGYADPAECSEADDAASRLQARGSCDNAAGECVTYYSDQAHTNPLGSYVPTCKGNCFQYSSFQSLRTEGALAKGTDCAVYSDSNCQNKIADTGNHIAVQYTSFSSANSMQCYYNC